MGTALAADRIQFGLTIMFHYLFPITTMGLAPFVAWYSLRAARTGDAKFDLAARFWAKIFAVNFAIGIVTGIPMEFQFGTNWAIFSERTGSVVGQPLAMEGLFAFFLESVFLGVFLFGGKRVSARLHVASAVLVWAGSWLSGYFIIVVDAWMQHPVGYAITSDGRIVLENLAAVLLSPFAWWQYLHVMTGSILAGGFLVAGVGAYYLLARRQEPYGRLFANAGIVVAFAFSILAIFPTGDHNAANVTEFQPAKLAAMEGLFHSTDGAPLAIIGMPDSKTETLIDPISVPDLLSFLAYGNAHAGVKGITAYPPADRPPVEVTYYAYHVMITLGGMFLGLSSLAFVLRCTGLLERNRWLLWLLMLAMPFPYIANEAGWLVTEIGRQPWLVYGIMRTAEGASANVAATETIFTIVGFVGMYALLGLLFVLLVLRQIGIGPAGQVAAETPA